MNHSQNNICVYKFTERSLLEKPIPRGWGYRHQQCFILFFTFTIAISIRACLSVALVAMTDMPTNSPVNNHKHNLTSYLESNDTVYLNKTEIDRTSSPGSNIKTDDEEFRLVGLWNTLMFIKPYPIFKWSKKIQDTTMSSFFWGYMLLQIPSGMLSHRYGSRYLLTVCMLVNGLTFILLPWIAFYGDWMCVCFCRFLQGLSQACVMPAMHTFFGKWAPLRERSRLTSLVHGGQALGPVIAFPITGFIASSGLGWPGIFRFYGFLGLFVSCIVWWFLADSPSQHENISDVERRYIEDELGEGQKLLSVPWSSILTSKGMWAIMAAHIGQTWTQLTLYTEVPAFMNKVMGVNIKANGVLTALPFLAMWLTNFLYSYISDMMINKKFCSVTNARKIATSFGSTFMGLGLIIFCFVPKDIYIVETVLVLTSCFKMASFMGFAVNNIDISPNFSGTMMSISNFAANSVGSFAPIVAGFLLTDVTSESHWSWVFYLSSAMLFISNLIYVSLGTSERAEWNEPKEKEQNEEAAPMHKIVNDDP